MTPFELRLWGSLSVFAGSLVTGPLILLPFDMIARGPTRTAIELLSLCILPYLVWIVAIWLCGRLSALWEYLALLVATLGAMFLAIVLPLTFRLPLPEGGDFKTDGLQALLFVTPVWLTLQFAFFATLVFDTMRRAIIRAAREPPRVRRPSTG